MYEKSRINETIGGTNIFNELYQDAKRKQNRKK